MDDGAEASREYERLRAELAEFVLDTLKERVAAGDEPRLSQALTEAIDKRVDVAVQDRLARAKWPDPQDFADAVVEAAGGRGGDRLSATVTRTRAGEGKTKGGGSGRASVRPAALTPLQMVLVGLAGIVIGAVLAFLILRGTASAPGRNDAGERDLIIEERNAQAPLGNTANQAGSNNGVADAARERR